MAYDLSNPDISATLEIIRRYAGVSSDAGLAKKLGISKERLRQWKLRSVYDIDVIRNSFPEFSADWLRTGEGSPFTIEGIDHIISNLDSLRSLIGSKDEVILQQTRHILKLTDAFTKK
jgi:hypothetical protein